MAEDSGFARFGTSTTDQVWFEARFTVDAVANSQGAMFLGLCEMTEQPTSVITLVDATGIPDASEDFVGFSQISADGNALRNIYQEGGQTVASLGTANVIVADTFYKIGLRYRGGAGNNQLGKLEYFVNGAVVHTYHVSSSDSFPDTNHLGLMFATKSTDGTETKYGLDWWRVAAVGGNV